MMPVAASPVDQQIGARVREARLTGGFTQEDLAHALGVNRTTIARYESGIRSLSVSTLLQLAQVLAVPLPSLLPGGADGASAPPTGSGAPAQRTALATLVRILEQCPEFVPQVLDTVEVLLQETRRAETDRPLRRGEA